MHCSPRSVLSQRFWEHMSYMQLCTSECNCQSQVRRFRHLLSLLSGRILVRIQLSPVRHPKDITVV